MRVFYPRFRLEELIHRLEERLPALRAELPVRRTVLFGSWATGRATAFSDIDLLVIYADPPRSDAYRCVRRALALRGLEPHVYSESEARALGATVERMLADGVELRG